MPTPLPRDVELYVARALNTVDWAALKARTPDLCHDCPQYAREQDPDDPVCLSCPWWGVLYAHLVAEHWRPHGRRVRRASSQEGGPDHD